jgi:hypothetical protein
LDESENQQHTPFVEVHVLCDYGSAGGRIVRVIRTASGPDAGRVELRLEKDEPDGFVSGPAVLCLGPGQEDVAFTAALAVWDALTLVAQQEGDGSA